MTQFNVSTKTLFLTYSQLDEDAQHRFFDRATAHYDFIVDTFRNPSVYLLARELHQDGGIHAHCYVAWESAIRIRSERKCDFGGAHPNIQSVRSGHRRTYDYVGKDSDVIYRLGDPPRELGAPPTPDNNIWADVIASATEDEFRQKIRTLAPRYYVLYQSQIDKYAERHFPPPKRVYGGPSFDDHSSGRCGEWLLGAALGDGSTGHRRRSLILWGPTKTGKTVWARSLGRLVSNSPHQSSPRSSPPKALPYGTNRP